MKSFLPVIMFSERGRRPAFVAAPSVSRQAVTSKHGKKEKPSGQTALSHQNQLGKCSQVRHPKGRSRNNGRDGLCVHCRKWLAGKASPRRPHGTSFPHRKSKLQRIACPRLNLYRHCAFMSLPNQTAPAKAPSFITFRTST